MKKVCFISQCSLPIPTTKGGAVETLVEYLINENEKKPRYEFIVISLFDKEAEVLSKKYKYTKFIFVNESNDFVDKFYNLCQRVMKKIGIYVPFTHTFSKAIKQLRRIPEQDLYIYEAGPSTQIPIISRYVGNEKLAIHLHWDGMGNEYYAKKADNVIAISKYIERCWANSTNKKNQTVVLLNCVNKDYFSKKVSNEEELVIRKKLNISLNEKVVLFVGRIVPEKGIKELIQAYNQVEIDNSVLVIVGSSNFGKKTNTQYEKEVQELIEKSNKRIIFTGYVHQKELYKIYSVATCAVMPSQFEEPAGLVALEAQATGTPLIATNVGGLGEFCSPEGTILIKRDTEQIYNLRKMIEKLLRDDELCMMMGKAGKEFVDLFDTEQYYNKFDEIVSKIIAEEGKK